MIPPNLPTRLIRVFSGLAVFTMLALSPLRAGQPPSGMDRTITLNEDSTYEFNVADYGFSDAGDVPPNTLTGIKVKTLPGAGTLALDGRAVAQNGFISVKPLSGIVWTPRESSRAWRATAISSNGAIIAALGYENQETSIFVSMDGGVSWNRREGPRECVDIACSADGSKMIVSSASKLYTSTDFGVSWTACNAVGFWSQVESSDDGLVLYANGGYLHRSLDSGLTWTRLDWAPSYRIFTTLGDGSRIFVASHTGALNFSQDFGDTWLFRGVIPGFTSALASSSDGTRLIAGGLRPSGGAARFLATSSDSGVTWNEKSGLGSDFAESSSDARVLVAITGGQIITSRDFGNTWTARFTNQPWTSLACSADGSKLLAGGSNIPLYVSDPTVPPLTYRPPRDQNGSPYSSFTFQVEDSGEALSNLALEANTITFNVANTPDAPRITPIPEGFAPVGSVLHWILPSEHFTDVDPGSVLTYSLTMADGGALPGWLAFDSVTRTFSGTPSEENRGSLDLQVTVTDNGVPPLSSSTVVRLTSGSDAPDGTDSSGEMNEDASYVFAGADFGFTDPGDQPADQFTGIRIATLPAAGTLDVEGVPVVAGDFVSTSLEARLRWTPGGSARSLASITSSADGARLAAAGDSALHFSSDSGLTWTTRQSGQNWDCIASSADGMKLVAAVDNGRLYTSTDAGITWQARDADRYWQAVASSFDGTKLIACVRGGKLYTSGDSGATWTPRSITAIWQSVASSHDGTKLIAAAYDGLLYTSLDSGVTWTSREKFRYWRAVASSADGSRLAAVDGASIYLSSDSGVSWLATQYGRWTNIASSADGTKLVAVADGGLINTSRDGGQRWTTRERKNNWLCVASSADGDKLAAAGLNVSVYTSTAAVPQLRFSPALNGFGSPYTNFTFQVEDSGQGGPTRDPSANRFTLNVRPVNDPPKVALPVPDRSAPEWLPFSYPMDAGYFSDFDPDTVLTLSARKADGSPLPPWLAFNPATRTFSGTPRVVDIGSVAVEVTAADNGQPPLAVSDIFEISVANVDDPPSGNDGMASVEAGAAYTFAPPDFGFSDPEDSPPNVFSWLKISTLPTAGTLTADGASATVGRRVRMVATVPGQEWSSRETNRVWAAIASSTDGTKLVAAAGGASTTGRIYTSIDSGVTWNPRESNRNWYAVASSSDGVKLVAAVRLNGFLYTSANSGATWTPRFSSGAWSAVASSADGTKLVAADVGGRLYTSVDSGLKWTPRESNRSWQALASSSDGTRLAAAESFGKIYLSTDSGVTWTPSAQTLRWRSIASSADGIKLAAVVQDGQIYTSPDSGATWTPHGSVRTWYSITSSADGTRLAAVAQNDRIYISADSGVTWKARETSRNWRCVASSADGSKLAAAVNGGQIFTSAIQPAGTLVFTPAPEGNGKPYTSFLFQVEDDAAAPAQNLDPTPNRFYLNIGAPAPFQTWAFQHALSPDPNADGGANLLRYSFGMEPAGGNPVLVIEGGAVVRRGGPAILPPGPSLQGFSASFGRRKASGLTSSVQFSENLTTWETSLTPPAILADDGVIEACAVPFPATLSSGQIPRFFRVTVSMP